MEKGILFALALTLATPAPVFANGEDHNVSPGLLVDLNAWLNAETEYTGPDSQPQIRLVSRTEVEALNGSAERHGGATRGLYDDASGTIYLTEPWSADNLRDVSVLVHELVHQRQSARHWYCPQAQEWRAYQIQAQWLQGQDLEDSFYWPAIMLQSSCAKRDIHPS